MIFPVRPVRSPSDPGGLVYWGRGLTINGLRVPRKTSYAGFSRYPAGLVYLGKGYKSTAYVTDDHIPSPIPLRFFEVPQWSNSCWSFIKTKYLRNGTPDKLAVCNTRTLALYFEFNPWLLYYSKLMGTSKNQFRQLFEVPCGTCLLG